MPTQEESRRRQKEAEKNGAAASGGGGAAAGGGGAELGSVEAGAALVLCSDGQLHPASSLRWPSSELSSLPYALQEAALLASEAGGDEGQPPPLLLHSSVHGGHFYISTAGLFTLARRALLH